jgi:hypothetical protein
MAPWSVRFGVRSWKLSNVSHEMGDQKFIFQAPPCYGRHVMSLVPAALQSLAPTNPHWARVVGYGPFSLCVTVINAPAV